ncbi:MAG: NAD(P)/FAD-dependent oxidoreductase [Devosia sp.]
MLGDQRSHGLWEQSAPPAPPTGPLRGDRTAEVAIVGAGFTGLSAALHLAQAGVRVVVLEAAAIGFGGSGRNVGLVNAGMWTHPDVVVERLGEETGNRLVTLLGAAPDLVFSLIRTHAIACEPVRNGTLHLAVGTRGLEEISSRQAAWARRGAPVRVLDAAETARRVGSSAYAGALLDMRAGTIQPLGYVRGLAHAAIAAGAEIFTGSAVESYEPEGGRWRLRTSRSSLMAEWVIAATNAYSTGPWAPVASEIVPFPYFNFATTPLSQQQLETVLPGREGAWDTRTVLTSYRLDAAGRLVFGSVGALRNTGTAIHRDWARRAMGKLFPHLRGLGFEHEWYGRIGMTDDDLPRFHELAPCVIGFSGYNGRGIGPGTAFGKVLAEHIIAEGRSTLPLLNTPVTPARNRTLRALGIEAGAQALHLVEKRF